MKKIIKTDNHEVVLRSNSRWYEIEHELPEDELVSDEVRSYIQVGSEKFYLDEFIRLSQNCSDWEKGFDGVMGTSYFSGYYIKFNKSCDSCQLYRMSC